MQYITRKKIIFKNIKELITYLEVEFKGNLLSNDFRNITQCKLKFELGKNEVLFADYINTKNEKGKRTKQIKLQTIIIANDFSEIKGSFKGGL